MFYTLQAGIADAVASLESMENDTKQCRTYRVVGNLVLLEIISWFPASNDEIEYKCGMQQNWYVFLFHKLYLHIIFRNR